MTFLDRIIVLLLECLISQLINICKKENDNHQGFDSVEEGDNYYYEEEEEEEDDNEEEGGDEEHLENSKTVKIPTQSKPTISTKVNNSSNTSNKLSSSTSTKPIVPESVKQVSFRQSNFIFFQNVKITLINIP